MKTGKLSKLAMPKRESVDMSELELDMGPAESEGEALAGEEEADTGEGPAPKSDSLAKVADADLLAEVKKRGLMAHLSESSPEEKARDKAAGAGEQEDEYSEYA